MRLSEFMRVRAPQILDAWDEFASTVIHTGKSLDHKALRDHAGQILATIADDLDQPQTERARKAKSRGEAERDPAEGDTAAETHADTRIVAGFAIDAMITEYRALRASVLNLWTKDRTEPVTADDLAQLMRFNEAIDQAVTESVSRYTEQVNQSANLFMGVLGHDIRNPLGTIRLSAEVLVRSGKVSADAAAPILNSVKRIQGLVELMVDFSRAESAGEMPVERKEGDLRSYFEHVVAESGVRHGSRRLRLAAHGDFHGDWDEGRMGQLLSNLLENAMLYGARDEIVSVTMTSTPEDVTFTVHNQGRPISPQERERIFEARSRGAHDEQRAVEGLGLGLYICREIVKAHGGTIRVESDAENGTSFIVTMPRHAVPPEAEPATEPPTV